jgi:hypothetical protein
MDTETLALVRSELGVEQVVALLAAQDPVVALTAIAEALEHLTDDELRRTCAKVEGLGKLLEGIDPDDLEGIDLSIRHSTLARARLQLWRVELETHRSIGCRLRVAPAVPGRPKGDGGSPRRLTADTFGLTPYRTGQLVELAQLDDDAFITAREWGLAVLGGGKVPTLAKILRAVAAGGEAEGDEWSTTPELAEAARQSLGGRIGVDVASHYAAQAAIIMAECWYSLDRPTQRLGPREQAWASVHSITAAQWARARKTFGGKDGLDPLNPWYRAECPTLLGNPPYSRDDVAKFFERLRAERFAHPDLRFWWLVNMDPSKADQVELGLAGQHCAIAKRVSFLGANGLPRRGNNYSSVAFGGGGTPVERLAFAEAHRELGPVYQPAEPAVSIAHVVALGGAGRLDESQVRDLAGALGR